MNHHGNSLRLALHVGFQIAAVVLARRMDWNQSLPHFAFLVEGQTVVVEHWMKRTGHQNLKKVVSRIDLYPGIVGHWTSRMGHLYLLWLAFLNDFQIVVHWKKRTGLHHNLQRAALLIHS